MSGSHCARIETTNSSRNRWQTTMENFPLNLKVKSGPGVSTSCVLSHDKRISFGRNSENDCVLSNDPGISRRHFEIYFEDGKCWIKDLNSRNGTYVNNHSIITGQLKAGDEIRAGNTRLAVEVNPSKEDEDLLAGQRVGPKVNLMVEDATTVLVQRKLFSSKIARSKIDSDTFLQLFHDLPGQAVLVHGENQATETNKHVVAINENCTLYFPIDLNSLRQYISDAGSSSVMLMNFTIPRSKLIDHIREKSNSFGSPEDFLANYQELPLELSNALMHGIDLMFCRTGEPEEVAVIFEKRHSAWLSDLIQNADDSGQTINN